MTVFVIQVDPWVAAHLAVAVDVYLRRVRGMDAPFSELVQLRDGWARAAESDRERQEATTLAEPHALNEGPRMDRITVGLADAAKSLGVSVRTVERLIEAGEIPHVRLGSRNLIAVSDLDEFVARRRSTRAASDSQGRWRTRRKSGGDEA